ncbi:MAG: hypothetical protein GC171_01440 [Terrimonas sp.]|nr:hypothetical protein [Terrimonas sp.]
MKHPLSVTSRILVAFASGALLAVYFLPAWRIDLFAPQYPEGLSMFIWINKITGDVDIINGLNHYIGMKHISADMFPEFRFLPYVVGFFIVLGMLASITGNRKLLAAYVLFTVIGGVLVPYDLYRWGYAYGHELDPKAAIQVPGLSYQPPVFGHKRLLNFDAYSFPDVAGWIVFGAGLLAASVLFFEWYRSRKGRAIPVKTILIAFCMLIFPFTSCTVKPVPFNIGKDNCTMCKMGVADLRFGGEIITKKGKIFKFDDAGCLLTYIKSGEMDTTQIKDILIMNFLHPNTFITTSKSQFLVSSSIKSPMNSSIAGFENRAVAEKVKGENEGEIMSWQELQNSTAQ